MKPGCNKGEEGEEDNPYNEGGDIDKGKKELSDKDKENIARKQAAKDKRRRIHLLQARPHA